MKLVPIGLSAVLLGCASSRGPHEHASAPQEPIDVAAPTAAVPLASAAVAVTPSVAGDDAGAAPDARVRTPAETDRACEAGDDDACVDRGEAMRAGVALDPSAAPRNARALSLFRAACVRGHARGCEREGETLQDHAYYGVPDDDVAEAVAFDRACATGRAYACDRLGFAWWEGLIRVYVEQGRTRPYRWPDDRAAGMRLMRRACALGHERACEHVREAGATPPATSARAPSPPSGSPPPPTR